MTVAHCCCCCCHSSGRVGLVGLAVIAGGAAWWAQAHVEAIAGVTAGVLTAAGVAAGAVLVAVAVIVAVAVYGRRRGDVEEDAARAQLGLPPRTGATLTAAPARRELERAPVAPIRVQCVVEREVRR